MGVLSMSSSSSSYPPASSSASSSSSSSSSWSWSDGYFNQEQSKLGNRYFNESMATHKKLDKNAISNFTWNCYASVFWLQSCIFCLNLSYFTYGTCVGLDLYSENGSIKLLNTDPIRIRIHNTGYNKTILRVHLYTFYSYFVLRKKPL